MITRQVEQRNGALSTLNVIVEVSRDPDVMRRLATIRNVVEGRIVFTTSFGIEDQAIGHAIFSQGLDIEVVTLDTGRLFPETYDLWTRTERQYGRRIPALCPDHVSVEALVALQGINGFFASVEARRGLLRNPQDRAPWARARRCGGLDYRPARRSVGRPRRDLSCCH